MQIRVGKYHIRRGQQLDGSSCAVALALKGQIKIKNLEVFVPQNGPTKLNAPNGNYVEFELPIKVQKFIARFDLADDKRTVNPITFNIPQRVIRALKSGN